MSASQASVSLDVLSQAALDLLPAPVFLTAVPDGTVLRCNMRAAQLFGGNEGVPRRLSERLHGVAADASLLPALTDPIATALQIGSPLEDSEGLLEAAGHRLAVSVSIEPIRGIGGQVIAALTMCHNIARWKDAAAALGRSEQRLALALNAGKLGAWELDLQTLILTASAQCKANHGLAADEELQLETNIIRTIDVQH